MCMLSRLLLKLRINIYLIERALHNNFMAMSGMNKT